MLDWLKRQRPAIALDLFPTRRKKIKIFLKIEKDFLDLKLKLRGKGLFNLFLARETKNDFIEVIEQSDKIIVQPARSSIVEMAKKKHIRNNVILTKNELKQALGLSSEKDKTTKKPMFIQTPKVDSNSPQERKQWMESLRGWNCKCCEKW